jgi:stage II sporulation protein R
MGERKIIIFGIIFILIIMACIDIVRQPKEEQAYIRFHVIANSDSADDQALKLRIRDCLLTRFQNKFGDSDSIEESRSIIDRNLKEIELIAAEQVRASGENYEVRAELGHFDFPTKAYGSLVLPAGNYEALRVVIGDGKGANWWCVMFPPLCFVDITHGTAREAEILSEDAVKVQGSVPPEKQPVKTEYRFKLAELWENSKSEMTELFSFLPKWEG